MNTIPVATNVKPTIATVIQRKGCGRRFHDESMESFIFASFHE